MTQAERQLLLDFDDWMSLQLQDDHTRAGSTMIDRFLQQRDASHTKEQQ